jgi:hypothetical protein
MFRHAMEFLKQYASLKKSLPKHYFTSLFKDLSNEDLVALCGLLATKIGKTQKKTICNSKEASLGPTT